MKKLILSVFVTCLFSLNGFSQKLYTYPIGAQAYTFRNHFPKDVIKTLDIIQQMGIVELETGKQGNYTEEEFKQLCKDRGISIPSTGCGFEELANDPMGVVKKAKALGAKYVMCAWISHERNHFSIEDAKKAVEVFNKGGKILAENGLTFCYHDHGYEFGKYADGTLFDYIINHTDPKYVSFEMDVLWTLHGGGPTAPETYLAKYPNRFKLMHVKDLKKGVVGDLSGGTPAENDVPVGTGQGNWKKIIQLAKKNGIQHLFIEDESEKELINVPKSIEYLKTL